jgi:hypothetical protein
MNRLIVFAVAPQYFSHESITRLVVATSRLNNTFDNNSTINLRFYYWQQVTQVALYFVLSPFWLLLCSAARPGFRAAVRDKGVDAATKIGHVHLLQLL